MGKVTRLTGGDDKGSSQPRPPGEAPAEGELPRESVGQNLRAARLSRGDELSQVSRVLHIRGDYLEAIESDRPQKLPGRTYAIGFVRAYASYLGLDAPSLVSRYKLATAGLAESAPQVGPAPEPSGLRLGAGWTLSAIGAAALVVYGIYALSRPPATTMKPVAIRSNLAANTPLSRHGASRPEVPKSMPQAVAAASAAAPPTGQVFGVQNQGARVVLHAHALTHVLVEGPGDKVYINRLLHPGDVYRVPNLVGLSLTTPDGGAVSLEVDGRDAGTAGSTGHIVEAFSLDPATLAGRRSAGVPGQSDKVTP